MGMDLAVLALSIVKQGEEELPGVTDTVNPKRLGPKRATKIRKFFNLSKDDDVSASSIQTSPSKAANTRQGTALMLGEN